MSTVADLKPDPQNPRKITPEDLKRLRAAMEKYGDLGGIVLNRRSGHLVGGHQRVKNLNTSWTIKKTPTQDKSGTVAVGHIDTPWGRIAYREVDWDQRTERAANIAANKLSGAWDLPKLKEMLVHLDDGAFELKSLGFSDKELRQMIEGYGSIGEEADDAPPLAPKAISAVGDIWELGPHRIICGDAADFGVVEQIMGGKQADLLFTDPPYGVALGTKNKMLNSFQTSGRNSTPIKNDDLGTKELHDLLCKIFKNVRSVMSDTAAIFVCSPLGGRLGLMMMMMKDAGLEVRHVLTWVKNAPTFSLGHLDYDYQHEPILFTWIRTHKKKMAGPFTTSVWNVDKPRKSDEHPTMKPVALPLNAILNHTDEGDIVFDPFLGSGTTLIAADQSKRIARAIELEPRYIDVAVKRWETLTGGKARRL